MRIAAAAKASLCALFCAVVAFAQPAPAGEVTLTALQDCYEPGDTVSFTLANDRDSTIYMPHDPVWTIYDNIADTLVYPSLVLWVIVSLPGDSSATYTWNQDDYHFNPVPAGTYRVDISYSPQMDPWSLSTVSDTFDLKSDCPSTASDRGTWGEVKRLFR